jgi:hypothetical protein
LDYSTIRKLLWIHIQSDGGEVSCSSWETLEDILETNNTSVLSFFAGLVWGWFKLAEKMNLMKMKLDGDGKSPDFSIESLADTFKEQLERTATARDDQDFAKKYLSEKND